MRLTARRWLILLFSLVLGCGEDSSLGAPLYLEIVAEADSGVGLGGVPIYLDGQPVGETTRAGTLRTPVSGKPGRALRVRHQCPVGYEAPVNTAVVRLRRYDSDRPAPLQITLECRSLNRIAAFVVKAKNGPGLPVLLNGERVGTTNQFGVAHFSTAGPAGSEYLVDVDASGEPSLLPRSVSRLVSLPDADALFAITATFRSSGRAKKRPPHRRRIIKIE